MQVAKKESMYNIYTTPIMESFKGLEALPTCYKEYQDVFEKKNADMLPQHYPYDYIINL